MRFENKIKSLTKEEKDFLASYINFWLRKEYEEKEDKSGGLAYE